MLKANSKTAAAYCNVIGQSEPQPSYSPNGIYIGKTQVYKIPFFLDGDSLINPHVSVIGTTGSGKTYLVKSMITKLRMERGFDVLIIDWSSEYSDAVTFMSGRVWGGAEASCVRAGSLLSGVNSVDLSSIENELERAKIAQSVLAGVRAFMLSMEPAERVQKILVVDEAWKLPDLGKSLGKFFREGRKFGFMVVAATQLVDDVNNEVLANAACSFIFRLQGSCNLDGLVSSGLLEQRHTGKVQALGRGSCIVSLIYRNGYAPKRFVIEKVDGFHFKSYSIKSDSMGIKVTTGKLDSAVRLLGFGPEETMRIAKFFEDNAKGVDLVQLVGFLMGLGIGRANIVSFLRALGVPDMPTALAIESLKGVEFA